MGPTALQQKTTKKPPNTDIGRFLSSFGRRVGKRLGVEQKTLLKDVLPGLSIALPKQDNIDPAALFPSQPEEVWMEIGFGGGEFLVAQASRYPQVGIIGCEPYLNGVAGLLKQLPEESRSQVRLWTDDARDLLGKCKPGSFHRVFILFPDPWPKLRHHKRRIVSDRMLDLLHQKLAQNGQLILATDHVEYARWMREHIARHEGFAWQQGKENDLSQPPEGWAATRYEQKTRAMGRQPVFFKLKKQ